MENYFIENTISQTSDAFAHSLAYLLQDIYNNLKAQNDDRAKWIENKFVEELEALES